jgi:hypothetical protein
VKYSNRPGSMCSTSHHKAVEPPMVVIFEEGSTAAVTGPVRPSVVPYKFPSVPWHRGPMGFERRRNLTCVRFLPRSPLQPLAAKGGHKWPKKAA